MFNKKEISIIKKLQNDFPITPRPYRDLAEELGLSEDEVLEITRDLMARGCIKRIGCALKHTEIGYNFNVMAVWDIEEERVNQCGEIMAAYDSISHCYERSRYKSFDYNIYTMIHGTSETEIRNTVADLERQVRPNKYKLLRSVKELKKTGMQFFT